MICTVNLRISSGHVNLPLPPSPVMKDSAATFIMEGVPNSRDGVAITSTRLTVVNAAGVTLTVDAVAYGKNWTATIPESHFAAAGSTKRGVSVNVFGTDENGASRHWTVGAGDLVVIAYDSASVNLGEYVNLRLLAAEPETPHKGDLVKDGGAYKVFNGTEWDSLGGGGGAVESVNGKTGAVELTAEDVGALAEDGTAEKAEVLRNGSTWQEAEIMLDDNGVARINVYDRSMGEEGPLVGRTAYLSDLPAVPVQSVNSKTGAVVLAASDVGAASAADVRYLLTQGAQSDGFIELAANRTKYVLLGGESFGGAVSILLSNDEIAGRVTDSVLVVMADRDTTVTYDTLAGYVTWLSPDADGVKTIKANTPTMLYFTQIRQHSSTESAVYVVGKAELQEVA